MLFAGRKTNFHSALEICRNPILQRGLKLPRLNRLDSFLVQSVSKSVQHLDVVRMTVSAHRQTQGDYAVDSGISAV
jgi:hypothetical protein